MSKEPLKPLIDKLLRAYGYEEQLDNIAVVKAYEEFVGPMYVKHTKNVYYKKRVLFVELDSSTLKQEMSYSKEKVIQAVNEGLGKRMIDKIELR